MGASGRSGPMKWVFIGCGCFLGMAILAAGSCGVIVYLGAKALKKEYDAARDAGAAYLRHEYENMKGVGAFTKVDSSFVGSNINVTNAEGRAIIQYTVECAEAGHATATVWLRKQGGTWSGVAVEFRFRDQVHKAGEPFTMPSSSGSGD